MWREAVFSKFLNFLVNPFSMIQGCMYHGCPCEISKKGPDYMFFGKTLSERRANDFTKLAKLQAYFHCEVEEIWACKFSEKKKHPNVEAFFLQNQYLHPEASTLDAKI
jgi:hypothetical protein